MASKKPKDGLGHVYVLTNSAYPGLVKIGYTTNTPKTRAYFLSKPTGVPGRFVVAWATERIPEFKEVERAAHKRLRDCRHSGEFFRLSVSDAREAIEAAARSVRGEGGLEDLWQRLVKVAVVLFLFWLIAKYGFGVEVL